MTCPLTFFLDSKLFARTWQGEQSLLRDRAAQWGQRTKRVRSEHSGLERASRADRRSSPKRVGHRRARVCLQGGFSHTPLPCLCMALFLSKRHILPHIFLKDKIKGKRKKRGHMSSTGLGSNFTDTVGQASPRGPFQLSECSLLQPYHLFPPFIWTLIDKTLMFCSPHHSQ